MRADSTRIVDSASERETPTADLAALERIERLRYCIVCLRESADVRRRDVEAFERYALHGEKAEHVAKYFGISTGRLYGIRSEMLDRVRILMSRLDLELGEV